MLPVIYLNPAKRYFKRYFKKLKERPLKKQFHEAIQQIRLDPYIDESKIGYL